MAPLIWKNGEFLQLPESVDFRLLVIDSWRQRCGKTFGLGQHAARFSAAVAKMGSGLSEQQWRNIWLGISGILSSPENLRRELFPRISLLDCEDGTRHIGFEIRQGPAGRTTTPLTYSAGEDRSVCQ